MKTVKSMAYIAVSAVIMTVCSWLTVPFAVPFTMQTFAVFAVLLILGGKSGTAAIGLYIALGLVGLPVFSGFQGGFSHLAGPTGGYIAGFLLTGLLYLALEKAICGKKTVFTVLTLSVGLVLCYLAGTLWFVAVYGSRGESVGVFAALSTCVLPYILPDAAKLALAILVGGRVKKYIK